MAGTLTIEYRAERFVVSCSDERLIFTFKTLPEALRQIESIFDRNAGSTEAARDRWIEEFV